ncbi:iron ABC transporter permease [Roseibium sp. RKSG952]|uniref:FecCD family ABC transporter permease n=1 Tax=Roseibium sp. RKSG952 TaxID=2529384 RepID=UPI0012BD58C2|nr:iron ABC transporter permease [Roseibium sp. RKSG952]MTH95807.1 iron ABC transporter permease [Roseibium sp. RKSG952]
MSFPNSEAPVPLPLLWSVCIAVCSLSVALPILLGVADIPITEVAQALVGNGSIQTKIIIMDIRVPRIVTGALAGIHFAVAGLILQNITRNPLADPSIMGISQGAILAVTVFLLFAVYLQDPSANTLHALPVAWLPVIGTAGGIAAGAVIYALAFSRNLGPLQITLCGIAVGAVLHATAIGLMSGWGSTRMELLLEWLSGSLYARTWTHALFLLPFTIVGLLALPVMRRPLDLLRLDPLVARSRGVAYPWHFSIALVLSSVLAASAVGVVGPIVFVGLIVPHLARLLCGRRTSLVLPMTITLGAVTVTLGDLIGRLVGQVEEIPIGVITAICGAPLLIVLLRRLS